MTKTNKKPETFNVIVKYQKNKYTTVDGKRVICPGWGEPILFYDDLHQNGRGQMVVTCCTESESHSTASIDYFRNNCRPPRTEEEKKKADEWFAKYVLLCAEHPDEPQPVRKQKMVATPRYLKESDYTRVVGTRKPRVRTLTEDELASILYGVDNNQ